MVYGRYSTCSPHVYAPVFLWLGMGLVVLPFVGWGFFGPAITPVIAVIFHLIYGVIDG